MLTTPEQLLVEMVTVLVENNEPVPVDTYYKLASEGVDVNELIKNIEESK